MHNGEGYNMPLTSTLFPLIYYFKINLFFVQKKNEVILLRRRLLVFLVIFILCKLQTFMELKITIIILVIIHLDKQFQSALILIM